jgi:hypothetical protein
VQCFQGTHRDAAAASPAAAAPTLRRTTVRTPAEMGARTRRQWAVYTWVGDTLCCCVRAFVCLCHREYGRTSRQLMACLNGLLLSYGADLRPHLPSTYKAVGSYIKHAWAAHTSVPVKVRACAVSSVLQPLSLVKLQCTKSLHTAPQGMADPKSYVTLADMLLLHCLCHHPAGWSAMLLPAVSCAGQHPYSWWWRAAERPAQLSDKGDQHARLQLVRPTSQALLPGLMLLPVVLPPPCLCTTQTCR